MTQERALDEKIAKMRKPETTQTPDKRHAGGAGAEVPGLIRLQQQVGNRAVQRLLAPRTGAGLAQRSGDGSFDLDDATVERINRARGSGHSLDNVVQEQMSESMGHDFSGVQVHTSPETDDLNRQLSAKAFTTGQDIFFRQGAYEPGSSSGRELIAHELTHVVQQSSGLVGDGGRMTVRPAGDAYEQEADAAAKAATNTGVQMQPIQRQEEEELQMQPIQRQEEEELQMQPIQRQEEEELQMQPTQRQDEEELQMQAIQRQDEETPEAEL